MPRWERPFWVREQLEVVIREGLFPATSWYFGRWVWHRCTVESGLESHLKYPDSFEIPSDEYKELLRPGDRVKLMWSVKRLPGERMWVTITAREGDRVVGSLDNCPVFVHLNPGESVKFHIDDIIDCIFEGVEDVTLSLI